MFIAHLPAGYIVSKAFKNHVLKTGVLLGSIIPDIDLFYFYTFGQRAVMHHKYWTHMPFFWIVIALTTWLLAKIFKPNFALLPLGLLAGTFLHLSLDSIAGSIYWFAPFSDFSLTLVEIPARYDSWQKNYFFHWTFAIEIMICLLAAFLVLKASRSNS